MSAKGDSGVEWKWADIRDMPHLETSSFDVAFDKGTMDAMIHGSPWDPPDEVKDNTSRYLKEVGCYTRLVPWIALIRNRHTASWRTMASSSMSPSDNHISSGHYWVWVVSGSSEWRHYLVAKAHSTTTAGYWRKLRLHDEQRRPAEWWEDNEKSPRKEISIQERHKR